MEMEIPVIDLKGLNGDDTERSRTMARLHEACKDWGCFWVDNHGVDPALMEEVKHFVYGYYEEQLEHKFYASDLAKSLQAGRPDDSNHVSDQVDWETTYFVQHHPKNNVADSTEIPAKMRMQRNAGDVVAVPRWRGGSDGVQSHDREEAVCKLSHAREEWRLERRRPDREAIKVITAIRRGEAPDYLHTF